MLTNYAPVLILLGLVLALVVLTVTIGLSGSTEVWRRPPLEVLRAMFDVNMKAVVELTHAFLPGMRHRGRGRIVNVASNAAFQPVPFLTVYAATKAFTSWWSAAVARKSGDRVQVFTVSPGSNMGTNAARHTTGFKRLLFTKIMPFIGSFIGMNMPTPVGARRYVDVLTANGLYASGRSYMSKPKKITGPMAEQTAGHLLDMTRQDTAFDVICELTGTAVGGGSGN